MAAHDPSPDPTEERH